MSAQVGVGELRAPRTPEGRVLLRIVGEHVDQIRAGAEVNDRDGTFPVETFEAFGKSGLMGATVPADLGGLGVSRMYDVATALSMVAEADASTALAWHVQLSRGLTLTYEWQHGAPHVRVLAERLLRGMAAGTAVVCGTVKDHPTTVTTLTPDGSDHWRLSGRKMLVSMAEIASHFVIHTQTDVDGEPPRLAVVVVPRDTPGLTVLDNWDGLGMRASGSVDVAFDDCRIATGDILAFRAIGAGDDAALAGQTVSSVTMLGIYVGIAQAARDMAVGMFAGRRADPPAAVRTLLAETDAYLYTLRAAAGAAVGNADDLSADFTEEPGERGRRMMTPFQCAKMAVNQLSLTVVNNCLTIVGGASFTAAHPLSRLYRDVRAGWFMQPYTYIEGVNYLSAQALGLHRDNDYASVRAARARAAR